MHLGVSSDFLVRELKDRVERVGGKCWKLGVTWGMGNGSWPEEYDELQHLDGIHFMGTAPIFDPAHTQIYFKRILRFSANLVSFVLADRVPLQKLDIQKNGRPTQVDPAR